MAVAADRNPWIASPAGDAGDFSLFNPAGTMQQQKQGNSMSDQEDGQNVLYMDSHVAFEKRSFCAINEDNVCTFWANPSPKWQQESWVGRLWLRLLCLVADEDIDLGDLAQIADAWPDPGAPGLVLAS